MTRVRSILLAAAVAGVSLFAAAGASAQIRVGSDGRALDANNQVGSFGINPGSRSPVTEQYLGNALITGNVTGFKYFRGGVPYADQNSFRGGMPSANFDSFIARSSGAPTPGVPPQLPGETRRFYGRDTVQLPPNVVQQPGTGVYYTRPERPEQEQRELFDQRIRTEIIQSGVLRQVTPGDVVMPGPVDPLTNLPTLMTASPLMGVRTWRPQDLTDQGFLMGNPHLRQESALERLRLDSRTLEQMRNEVSESVDGAQQQSNNLARPLPQPFDAPQNGPLQGGRIDAAITADPLGNAVRAEGSMVRRMPSAPSVQSAQYAELENRLNRYYQDRLKTDEQKHREYLQQLRARQAQQARPKSDDPTAPSTPTPGVNNPGNNNVLTPGAPRVAPDYARIGRELTRPGGATAAEGANIRRPDPVKIASLADGVKAEGLAKLLRDAEAQMKAGKYATALDQFEAAQEVAPNNAMILVGRANAELGAGYYKKAEDHLRIAMQSDPVVTMAQFDLKGMIGEQRLNTIARDLKDTAMAQKQDAGLVLLLAYLAYNSGAEAQAQTWLAEADRRAGGKDELVTLLRNHWKLPEVPGGNK